MTTYGYIRTSRDQEPGHPAAPPKSNVDSSSGPAWNQRRSTPTSRYQGPRVTTAATSGTSWITNSPRATCWWLLPSTAWGGVT